MRNMFGRFKRKPRDKYDVLIPYLGITQREYMMGSKEYEIKLLRKKVIKSINDNIKKIHKMSDAEIVALYDDVMKAKHDFVKNENVWSRVGNLAERANIAIHGYETLRDTLMEEKKKRKILDI